MKLFYKTIGEGKPLLILHGLFGSADNWQTHARTFSEQYKVYLIDQRNHGHSPHSDDMSYELMAEDLYELIASEGLRDVNLIGHSMGGKTILTFAQQHGFLIDKMIVADMGVKAYPPHHEAVFAGLFAVDIDHCESRKEAESRLSQHVQDFSTQQFLLKNMYWIEPGKLAWRFNLNTLSEKRGELMHQITQDKIENEVLFLHGGKSNYVLEEDYDDIRSIAPKAKFETIANAGHWLHAEAPTVFMEKCLACLQE